MMQITNEDILRTYEMKQSVRATAAALGVCHAVVRKALISSGIPCTERSKEINDMISYGKTVPEISKELHVSEKAVRQYLPYTKGSYRLTTPTENALIIRRCRIKKHFATGKK